jgi:Leucine-rich repeat (LRR) protein
MVAAPTTFTQVKFELTLCCANIETLKLPYLNDSELITLNITLSNITSIPDHAFIRVPLLQRLGLSSNKIKTVSTNTFHKLHYLLFLDLSYNLLESIGENSFGHLNLLRYLFLDHNMLKALTSAIFEPLYSLEIVYLHENPWVCECNETLSYWMLNNHEKVQRMDDIACNNTGELFVLNNRTCSINSSIHTNEVLVYNSAHVKTSGLVAAGVVIVMTTTLQRNCG